jgi:hypothetical protein
MTTHTIEFERSVADSDKVGYIKAILTGKHQVFPSLVENIKINSGLWTLNVDNLGVGRLTIDPTPDGIPDQKVIHKNGEVKEVIKEPTEVVINEENPLCYMRCKGEITGIIFYEKPV